MGGSLGQGEKGVLAVFILGVQLLLVLMYKFYFFTGWLFSILSLFNHQYSISQQQGSPFFEIMKYQLTILSSQAAWQILQWSPMVNTKMLLNWSSTPTHFSSHIFSYLWTLAWNLCLCSDSERWQIVPSDQPQWHFCWHSSEKEHFCLLLSSSEADQVEAEVHSPPDLLAWSFLH